MSKKNLLKEVAQFAPRSYNNVSGAPTPVDARLWLELMLEAKNLGSWGSMTNRGAYADPELMNRQYWNDKLEELTKKMMKSKGNSAGYEGRRNWIASDPRTGMEFQFESGSRPNAEAQLQRMMGGWEGFNLNEVYGPQDWTHYRSWPGYRFDDAVKEGMLRYLNKDIDEREACFDGRKKCWDWYHGKERQKKLDMEREALEKNKALRSRLNITDEDIMLDPMMYTGDEYPYLIRDKASKIISGED